MTDHAIGQPLRRQDSLEVIVARIDARTEQMVKHLETLNSRTGKLEDRVTLVERRHEREDGASGERKVWLGVVGSLSGKAVPGVVGAGGGYLMALLHAYVLSGGKGP